MQVYLHIYFHIYVQLAHNFDTFYATTLKLGMILPDQDLRLYVRVAHGRGQGSEYIAGHIEHMQNGSRIMSGTITFPRKLEIGYNDHR